MITYPFTDKGVADALAALGTTENAVATNLYALGYRGVPGSESQDPTARYLVDSIEEARSAAVYLDKDEAFADVWMRDEDGRQVSVTADLPTPVIGLVAGFDKRKYPDLIEETNHA